MDKRLNEVRDTFQKGCLILEPILKKYGFEYFDTGSGGSCGGPFMSGGYKKEDRKIEFSYRWGLGCVVYKIGDLSLDHDVYMKFLGVHGKSKYPGFGKDLLDAFRDLHYDLENFLGDFLSGSGQDFIKYAKDFQRSPNIFKGLP